MNKYPTYKPSNIPWLGDVPEHWTAGRIKQLFQNIGSGTTPIAGTPKYYDDGTIPWVNTGDLNDGELYRCKKKITQIAFGEHSPLKLYEVDTLLIAMYGATIGKAAILKFEACTNQACCALSKSKIADTKFVFYWFIANKQNIIDLSYGGGQPNISQEIIRNLKLPLPPLPEQTQIVRYSDWQVSRIGKLISAKKKQIALLKEQKQNIINAHLYGEKVMLKRLLLQPLQYGANESGVEYSADLPRYVRITDISADGLLKTDKAKSLSSEKAKPYILKDGDILLARSGATVGKSFLYQSKHGVCAFAGYLIMARFNQKLILPQYFSYITNSSYYEQWKSTIFIQATIQNISAEKYYQFQIPLPSIEKQQEIIKTLDKATAKIDLAIDNAEREIALINEYRIRLISDVVTGKVDVRGVDVPEFEPVEEIIDSSEDELIEEEMEETI
ncbi:restriction endonuclease S subunit [Bacteroidia bacterium]|nr:restriction endonuclease S subunit [Bacteroidia bacterium]